MRQAVPDTTRKTRGPRGLALLATLVLAGFAAAPAQAGGNEFDDGFQDPLGRLVASEVFHLGKWIVAGGPTYVHYDPEPVVHYRATRRDRGHGHAKHHARGHGHYKHHRKHHSGRRHYWRKHPGHSHDYQATCNVETHERVRRNRHGEVVEYERHERHSGDRYARR